MVDLVRRQIPQAPAGPAVELIVHHRDLPVAYGVQVAALGEVLPQQPVGVLVGPALPRVVRRAEVALRARRLGEQGVLGELLAPVEGDGLHGAAAHRRDHRLPHVPLPLGGRLPAGQVAARAVDHGDEARAAGAAGDGVALPVADARAGARLGGALGELVRHLDPPPQLGAVPALPPPAAAPEPRRRLAAAYAAVELARADPAVDRRVADGEAGALEEDPALQLLGRPAPLEHVRPDELEPLGVVEQAGAAARRPPLLVAPLGGRGAVEARARVARELPRDGRLVPAYRAGDLADALPLPEEAHDVLPLLDGKMSVAAHGSLLMMLSSQAPSYQDAVGRPFGRPLQLE